MTPCSDQQFPDQNMTPAVDVDGTLADVATPGVRADLVFGYGQLAPLMEDPETARVIDDGLDMP